LGANYVEEGSAQKDEGQKDPKKRIRKVVEQWGKKVMKRYLQTGKKGWGEKGKSPFGAVGKEIGGK